MVYFSNLYAQYDRPFFNTISIQNSLPEGFVQSTLQDKFGYLWFGPQQGLVRYDGYQTKLYNFFDDTGEFVKHASVQSLFEDNRRLLWAVLMYHGIYKSYCTSQNRRVVTRSPPIEAEAAS